MMDGAREVDQVRELVEQPSASTEDKESYNERVRIEEC